MASGDINLNLNVLDKSGTIKSRTQEAKELNKELDKAANRTTGTRSGSMAAKRAGFQPAEGGISDQEYNRGRGAAGITGAGARDFANQAQGLGGLVRLYATYAANVFAVGAAFEALRSSMATDIMIRSMDRLGASSGIALGGLAKQFASATDGAISFREAAEAATKATSAGLSTKQFMELGTVAKGASQALGISMNDAVSRLTRGIVKLEPELLDELGIFTKIGPATEQYARSIGKTADSLTDFERRQAFANAVLAEGKEKFGAIAGDSNPYDKLLASLKDTAQQILSVVNGPISKLAGILADNIGLIGAAIALAAIKITQQALPALLDWRKSLATAAKDAAERAAEISSTYQSNIVESLEKQALIPDLKEKIQASKAEVVKGAKEILTARDGALSRSKATVNILEKAKTGQELDYKEISQLKRDSTRLSKLEGEENQRVAASLRSVAAAAANTKREILQLNQAYEFQVAPQADKPIRRISGEGRRVANARNAARDVTVSNILEDLPDQISKKGLKTGLLDLYSEVDARKDLGRLDKFKTKARGTITAVATEAGIWLKSFSSLVGYVGAAVGAYQLLDSIFSNAGKALDSFRSAVDSVSDTVNTATNVNEKYMGSLSPEALNARATALGGIRDKMDEIRSSFLSAKNEFSWWDTAKNFIKEIFGQGINSDLRDGLSSLISGAIASLPAGPLRDQYEAKLQKITGAIDPAKAISKLGGAKLQAVARDIADVTDAAFKGLDKSRRDSEAVAEATKALDTSYQNFRNSATSLDTTQKFLLDLINNSARLAESFKTTEGAASSFIRILRGQEKLELLGPDAAARIAGLRDEFSRLQAEQQSLYNQRIAAERKLKDLNADQATARNARGRFRQQQIDDAKEAIRALDPQFREIEKRLSSLGISAGQIIAADITRQFDLILAQFKLKQEQDRIAATSSVLKNVPFQSEASIKLQSTLDKRQIDVQTSLALSNNNLINSIDALNETIKLEQAEKNLENIKNAPIGRGRGGNIADRDAAINQAQAAYDAQLKVSNAVQSGSLKGLSSQEIANSPALRTLSLRQNSAAVIQNKATLEKRLVDFNAEFSALKLGSDRTIQALDAEQKRIATERDNVLKAGGLSQTEITATQQEAQMQIDNLENTRKLVLQGLQTNQNATVARYLKEFNSMRNGPVAELIKGTIDAAAEQIQILASQSSEQTALSQQGQSAALALDASKTNAATKFQTRELQATQDLRGGQQRFDDNAATVALARSELDIAKERQTITDSQYTRLMAELDLQDANIAKQKALLNISASRLKIESEITRDIEAEGPNITPQRRSEIRAARQVELANLDADAKQATSQYDGTVAKIQNGLKTLTDEEIRLNSVTDRIGEGFLGIGDKISEFVMTGKTSFKDLTQSLIADLIKMELRFQMSQLWNSAMGRATATGGSPLALLVNAGVKAFTRSPVSLADTSNPVTAIGSMVSPTGNAKGNAFDYGMPVHEFAMGGAFTNSIVDNPTLFKFAKGTGLMGEAGPEAIMPLKRDSNGNLGVRADAPQANVQVVVNNNAPNTQASARETVDSRGNRKIEVVVADMVAGEMLRNGSGSNQAVRMATGVPQQPIRR